MKFLQRLQQIVVASACVGLLLPTAVFAQQPQIQKRTTKTIVDAELAADGALYGKVVNAGAVSYTHLTLPTKA